MRCLSSNTDFFGLADQLKVVKKMFDFIGNSEADRNLWIVGSSPTMTRKQLQALLKAVFPGFSFLSLKSKYSESRN
jgi:uncharacterized protein YgbK (DUF1537 family)